MLPSPTLSDATHLGFRIAGPEDVGPVVDLVESAYRGDSSRAGWTTEAELLDGQRTDAQEVSSLISREGSMVLLAEEETGLAGCCHLEFRRPSTAYFGMFAVRPGLQGSGVGRAILSEAARRAVRWGCEEMRMTVIRQRLELIRWYERLGFSATGETEPFPYGDERFGRPRRDDLEFIVLAAPLNRLSAERRTVTEGEVAQ